MEGKESQKNSSEKVIDDVYAHRERKIKEYQQSLQKQEVHKSLQGGPHPSVTGIYRGEFSKYVVWAQHSRWTKDEVEWLDVKDKKIFLFETLGGLIGAPIGGWLGMKRTPEGKLRIMRSFFCFSGMALVGATFGYYRGWKSTLKDLMKLENSPLADSIFLKVCRHHPKYIPRWRKLYPNRQHLLPLLIQEGNKEKPEVEKEQE